MTALLAAAAMCAGPLVFLAVALRVSARARAADVRGPREQRVEAVRALLTTGEVAATLTAVAVWAAGVVVLAVMAVLGV